MAVIRVDIFVSDLADVLAIFNRVQVHRSTTELGVYTEITGASAAAAVLDGATAGTFDLNGETLSIALDGATAQDVDFVSNGMTIAQVIAAVEDIIAGIASEVPTATDMLRLTSTTTGTGSSVLVSGAAATTLGLSTTKVNGVGARITLTDPTTDYSFSDLDGDATFWYKTRYSNSANSTVSTFSNPQEGVASSIISTSALSRATIDLATAEGKPMADRRIILVPVGSQAVEAIAVFEGQDRLVVTTNAAGHAEIDLIRGGVFKVFFEGSNFNRKFTVPDTSTFDLLTVVLAEQDPLSIINEEPPRPIRRS